MDSRREFLRRATLYAAPVIVTVAIRPALAQGPYNGSPGNGPNGGNDGPVGGADDEPIGGDNGPNGGNGPSGNGSNGPDPLDGGGGGAATRRGGSSDNWWERFVDQIEEI